jgi:branched-chain amino acid transport system permease protein
MVVGMFLALVLFRWLGFDPLLSIPVAVVVLFCVGYALQALVIKRVAHLADHMQFLLLAAIAIVIVSACLMIFGPDAQSAQTDYSLDTFAIGDLIIDKVRVYAAVAAVVVTAILLLFFRFTATGKAIRACADNYFGALVVGLNVNRLYALTFGIGAACLGAAGCIILLLVDVHPYLAPSYTLLAFVIVIVGGMGSLAGALLGGVLIGASEALAGIILEPSLKTAFSFALLIIVLLVRPQGLLGKAVQ